MPLFMEPLHWSTAAFVCGSCSDASLEGYKRVYLTRDTSPPVRSVIGNSGLFVTPDLMISDVLMKSTAQSSEVSYDKSIEWGDSFMSFKYY